MTAPILVRGGRVIDPRQGLDGPRDLLLKDGTVAAVSATPLAAGGAVVVEAQGKWVLPGLVDLHTHLREPGEEGKETIQTGCRAAVAGGYTAVVAMPNTRPVNDSPAVTAFVLHRARAVGLCRVYPAGTISKGQEGRELAEMGALVEAGCVTLTDDGRPVTSAGLMRNALLYAKHLGIRLMVHEEELTLSTGGTANEGPVALRLGLRAFPRSAETVMAARDLLLTEEVGAQIHLAHVSCEETVRLVREAKRRGVDVTAEATPHHFTLDDSALEAFPTEARMNPPLRRRRDVEAICEGLADGTLDAIATDHAPHSSLDKDVPFDSAASGVVGLETALGLSMGLVTRGVLSASRMVELLTAGPARALRLPCGTLSVGAPGDVTVVDPEARWRVEPASFLSKGRNTPFAGVELRGQVVRTFVDGRQVFGPEQVREWRS